MPEAIYAAGKTAAQVERFFPHGRDGGDVLATRADEAAVAAVKALVPEAQYRPVARIVALRQTRHARAAAPVRSPCSRRHQRPACGRGGGGEAEVMGAEVRASTMCELPACTGCSPTAEELREAEVVIVCAGMERIAQRGGGHGGAPVIAGPTSVADGAFFGGIVALLGMSNSCSPNVTVVNIDNGFGAADAAFTILRRIHQAAGKNTAQEMMR